MENLPSSLRSDHPLNEEIARLRKEVSILKSSLRRDRPESDDPLLFLSGGGQMGALIRAFNWSESALGAIQKWPQSLITITNTCLNSRFPFLIWWGPSMTAIYNDAYIPIFAGKHPSVLGKPGNQVWGEPEVWNVIAPMLEQVLSRGEATWSEDQLLLLQRRGFLEECYFTWSYSPIAAEGGSVGGILTSINEVTKRVLGERRLKTLRELGNKTTKARTVSEATQFTTQVLSQNQCDIPFSLIYLSDPTDRKKLILKNSTGIVENHPARFKEINVSNIHSDLPWKIEQVLRERKLWINEDLPSLYPGLPGGPWPESPNFAVSLPIASSDQENPLGVLVIGISPRLAFDDDYRGFLELISGQLATALSTTRAYEEEKRRAEALAEIDRAKTTFFANISHEFRTPLTLMLGPLEDNLADRIGVSPEHRERERLAYRNALRLLRLVNSLLDFSRIEAGRVKAFYRRTDLAKFTADLASVFRSTIEKAGLKLIVNTQAITTPVYIDRDMWEKIVFNLLSNAFKFTLHGEIEVSLRTSGEKVLLVVRDTGTGVSESEIPRLFERFHRVEGAQGRSHEGTGIGLALIQELVKLHGGQISVKSELAKGSEFTVALPLGKTHLAPDRTEGTEDEEDKDKEDAQSKVGTLGAAFVEEARRWLPDTLSNEVSTGEANFVDQDFIEYADSHYAIQTNEHRSKILLADDNADMRAYVKSILQSAWDVETVEDGQAAFERASRKSFDLLLSDVMMPRLDGFGLIEKLRANPKTKSLQIILLSARAGEESRIEGLQAGADDYLVKPFSAKELLARVNTHLQLGKARREAEADRAKLSSVVNNAPVILFSVNSLGIYTLFEGRALEALGYGPGQFAGESYKKVHQASPALIENVNRALNGETFTSDVQIENYWFETYYAPVRDVEGDITGMVGVSTDVTVRRKAEDALKLAVHSRDEFLSLASHEIKTPITGLKLQLQMTQRRIKPELNQAPTPEKLALVMSTSMRQVDRLVELVEDLLDVSKIQAGKLQYTFEELLVGDLIAEVVDRFSDQLNDAQISITVEVEPGLKAHWDRSRIEQVIANLISNTIKYACGGPVQIKAVAHEGGVILSIQDSGPGIPKEYQEKIFDRFQRATSSRNISGLGLGLYIVKQIVNGHSGKIYVESENGSGAKFIVELPILPVVLPIEMSESLAKRD